MGFLRENEFLIFMDCQAVDGQYLGVDDLKKLRNAGMQTAHWVDTSWDKFIVDGVVNWSYFDNYLERMRQADMKCIISLWQNQSRGYPAEWYCVKESRRRTWALSPWCDEAMEEYKRVLRMVIEEYTSDDVQFMTGQHQGNERVLLNAPAYYDRNAIADWRSHGYDGLPNHTTQEGKEWLMNSYTRLMTDLMEVFVDTQHREIWFALSRYKATKSDISCHGCEWIDDYLKAWWGLKPKSINHISFNYFPYGESYWDLIIEKNAEYNVNEFVGAEYCEGLKDGNGKRAVQQGLRGMIVGPTHIYAKHTRIEDWMVAQIRETHNAFTKRARASHVV